MLRSFKIYTNDLSIHLILYSKSEHCDFLITSFKNFPIQTIHYQVMENAELKQKLIVKNAKMIDTTFKPQIQVKYNNNRILLNNINILLPDLLRIPIHKRNIAKRLIFSKNFNSKLVVKYNESIIGIYGPDGYNISQPAFEAYNQHIYLKIKGKDDTQNNKENIRNTTHPGKETLTRKRKPAILSDSLSSLDDAIDIEQNVDLSDLD